MNKQVLNVSWGVDKKQSLTFNKTDSVYLVKSYLENITSVSVKDQQLLGLETNDDSLPLAVLEIANPQNVYLLNKNDFNISSLNEPQITVVKDPEEKNKEDENQKVEKKETETQNENKKAQENEKEKETQNKNENENEKDKTNESKTEKETENKKEKEKEMSNENETENQKDEKENEKEKGTETKKDEKFDPDLELAKQLQDQIWKQDLRIPKSTNTQNQGQSNVETKKGVGKGFGSEDLQRNTGMYYPPNYLKKQQQLRMRYFQKEKEKKEFENKQSLEMMAPFAPPSVGSDEVLKKKFVEYSDSVELPLISTEGFAEVCLTAKEINKSILIYLHSYTKDQENVSHFVKSVLTKPGIINLINQNFIFWVGDIDALESIEEMKELLNLKEFPYLAVLSNSTTLQILDVIQGKIDHDGFTLGILKQLQSFQSGNIPVKKSETVIEREKQDVDFELSRKQDLEKIRLQEIILHSQQDLKLQQELQFQKIREMIPDEPKQGEKNVTVLKIRLKNGEKLQRKFYNTDKLSAIFNLVKLTTKSFQKFKLISSYPKKTFLEDENFVEKSLEELGLVPQALLDIEFLD
ncbi:fas-associated protein [Anaeramoeba flamelloides]|uniref:Fas-associated protein n=1 Tax=Anaeramoeba flamelloides TaxID=1746091 RepID=A0AAV7Z8L9_9EUKA|nr:fas-associated protein [Anaeramoeba flamelloides]